MIEKSKTMRARHDRWLAYTLVPMSMCCLLHTDVVWPGGPIDFSWVSPWFRTGLMVLTALLAVTLGVYATVSARRIKRLAHKRQRMVCPYCWHDLGTNDDERCHECGEVCSKWDLAQYWNEQFLGFDRKNKQLP